MTLIRSFFMYRQALNSYFYNFIFILLCNFYIRLFIILIYILLLNIFFLAYRVEAETIGIGQGLLADYNYATCYNDKTYVKNMFLRSLSASNGNHYFLYKPLFKPSLFILKGTIYPYIPYYSVANITLDNYIDVLIRYFKILDSFDKTEYFPFTLGFLSKQFPNYSNFTEQLFSPIYSKEFIFSDPKQKEGYIHLCAGIATKDIISRMEHLTNMQKESIYNQQVIHYTLLLKNK